MTHSTHNVTPIEDHHFTPFASLLLHFPMAVNKVVGSSQIYYEYKPQKRTLEVTVFYRRIGGMGERIDLELTRTAYSFSELEDMVRQEYVWADHFYNHRGGVAHASCKECMSEFGEKLKDAMTKPIVT